MKLPDDRTRTILDAGLRAPSAENRHYLRFVLQDDTVWLEATATAQWQDAPHQALLAHLSFGAVIENTRLRALTLGLAQQVQWPAPGEPPQRIARLQWHATRQAPDPLAAAIELRHTNRAFFTREALPPETLQRLAAAATAAPGARLLWLNEPEPRRAALRAIRIAETERFRRKKLHRELFSGVRFDIGWHRSSDEGLPPATLAIEAPLRLPFAALRHWPLMRVLGWFGLHHGLGLRSGYLPCATAPHLGVVAVARGADLRRDALAAGQALQRVWLAAAAEGLAFQPMASAVALSLQHAGGGWVSPRAQRELRALLPETVRDGALQPWMFFRLGRAVPPAVVTGRAPLERYLG